MIPAKLVTIRPDLLLSELDGLRRRLLDAADGTPCPELRKRFLRRACSVESLADQIAGTALEPRALDRS